MRAGAASRYALGAGGVGAVRPAPAASLISASRYALGARRTALRACVPGAAAGCHRRLALRARRRWRGRCAPGRLRQAGRGLALRARRRWRGRCAPGRLHVFPPDNARVASSTFSAATISPPLTRRAASTARLTRLLPSSDLLHVTGGSCLGGFLVGGLFSPNCLSQRGVAIAASLICAQDAIRGRGYARLGGACHP